MAYREVRGMDIDQIIRRWLAGEKIRGIARSTGADRNTVRRIVRIADKEGIGREIPWPDEGKLQVIRQHMGRPGVAVAVSGSEQRLKPRTEQIRAWLDQDHLLLSKVHELLGREGSMSAGIAPWYVSISTASCSRPMSENSPAAARPTTPIIRTAELPTPCAGPTTTASGLGNSELPPAISPINF
jgi:hypothetical protein